MELARNRGSDFRNLAIDYLISIRASEFAPTALMLLDDPIVQRGIFYYFRKVPTREAISPLLGLLEKSVESNEIRVGVSATALETDIVYTLRMLSGKELDYSAHHALSERKLALRRIKTWWESEQAKAAAKEANSKARRQLATGKEKAAVSSQ